MIAKRQFWLGVAILPLVLILLILLVYDPVYSEDTELVPIESALHVLPPIGENTGDINSFDTTLTSHIKVIIWQLIGEEDYVQVAEFTSQSGGQGLDYVKLEDDQYHVNWNIKKAGAGKDYVIHFAAADLTVGYVTHSPKVGRTLPIIFRIDNHPSIRARLLKLEGYTAQEVASALIAEFQLGNSAIVQVLTDEEYDVLEIGETLRDVLGVGPGEAAQLLVDSGFYSVSDIAQLLAEVYDLVDDPQTVAQILKENGFSASQIFDVLRAEPFNLEEDSIIDILEALGFSSEELFAAASKALAEKFAPQLRFDQAASTFPMSAQTYFRNSIDDGSGVRIENNDPETLINPELAPPTYFQANLSNESDQIRILYWWYYGYQPGCWAGTKLEGVHDGDWERVMVTLSEDSSQVAAVTYWQHSGWYTRLADGADRKRYLDGLETSYEPGLEFYGDRPIIYVGKTQHGSYHNQGGDGLEGYSFCMYFDDYRNNGGHTDLRLNTENNLVSLADLEEDWMSEEMAETDVEIGTGDGTTTTFDLDSKYVSSVHVSMEGGVYDWWFEDNAGTDGVDQIVFSVAPADGVKITADLERGDFMWGGIGTHPIKESIPEKMGNLNNCRGADMTIYGETRGCFESQCKYHHNQTLWSKSYPGECSYCPAGYTDHGPYCAKGTWPWEWRIADKHYYILADYTLPRTDVGLLKKR